MAGHGQVGTGELIEQMKDYLKNLEISAEEIAIKNLNIEDSENLSVPDKYKDWWFDRFYEYNLRFAYESLKTSETK